MHGQNFVICYELVVLVYDDRVTKHELVVRMQIFFICSRLQPNDVINKFIVFLMYYIKLLIIILVIRIYTFFITKMNISYYILNHYFD